MGRRSPFTDFTTENKENLESGRCSMTPSSGRGSRLRKSDESLNFRALRAKQMDPNLRWSIDLYDETSNTRARDIQLSPLPFCQDSLFKRPVGFRNTRDLIRQKASSPSVKMTYISVKERPIENPMISQQSATNSPTTCASPSSNSRKTGLRSSGRKWLEGAGLVDQDEELKEMIKGLDNCRKKWENDGNYLQAATVSKQMHGLKIYLENKKRISMLETHSKEKEDAEIQYKAEVHEKHKLWSERFKVFQKEVMQHAQSLKEQHALALQNFRSKMDMRAPRKPQLSRDLLNERKVQTFLGKQGKYLEAQKVKRQADRKEIKELEATRAAFQAEVVLKEQALRAKQKTEMAILLQRAAQTRDELRKNKERDLTYCTQRQKNLVRDLEALHKQERLKHEHKMKKLINEFRALGGDLKDITHAMESLVVPVTSDKGQGQVFEVECLNITA